MLYVPVESIEYTSSPLFQKERKKLERYGITNLSPVTVTSEELGDELLEELLLAAKRSDDLAFESELNQIKEARAGKFSPIRSKNALSEVILAYIGAGRGTSVWLYYNAGFGVRQPFEVNDLIYNAGYNEKFYFSGANATGYSTSESHRSTVDSPGAFSYQGRRRPETLLAKLGLERETQDLRQAYRKSLQRVQEIVKLGNRVDVTDELWSVGSYSEMTRQEILKRVQCVVDFKLSEDMVTPIEDDAEYLPLASLRIPLFDLWSGRVVETYIGNVEQHSWRSDAVEKLVLPNAQKRVLELAVGEDAESFGGDFVDDKTPGNILLCKGNPGIGKTLTAEAYAEHTKSALYPVDMNVLASQNNVGDELRKILARARRWSAFVLLDEADVVVAKRGDDVHKNAVVAEILKAVERYEKPIFMTTNRPEDIDEAVISRCLMILHYNVPEGEHSKEAWRALSSSYKVDVTEETLSRFVDEIGSIAPREIGQIIRLSARMAARDQTAVSFDHLLESATMRGVAIPESESQK